MPKHVIIGNGIAGVSAVEAIRSLEPDAPITMIAAETFPPYCRPMISMVLQGGIPPDRLPIRKESYYEDLSVEPIIGHKVVKIDPSNKEIFTDQGLTVSFDKLLIATGADPRKIKAQGTDLANIEFMRTESHVKSMLEALPDVKSALVLGGGLVGFKAAYGLLHRGIKVTMLIRSGYPLSMQVDPVAGGMILDELVAKGLDVRVEIEAVAFEGNGKVREALLSDGTRHECQLVVIGKGVHPATSFVPKDKIGVDLGILVNEHMQTTHPDVYAAGDVAETNDVVRRQPWVNAIWPVAVEQGRLAGTNMAGRKVKYGGSMGRNVMRVFDLDVLTGGLVNPPEDNGYTTYIRHDPARKVFRRLVFRDDTPVGVAMVGKIENGGIVLSLIQRQLPLSIDPQRLLEPSFNYGQLMR
jgi:nitrite reductase (NADH) large subunit